MSKQTTLIIWLLAGSLLTATRVVGQKAELGGPAPDSITISRFEVLADTTFRLSPAEVMFAPGLAWQTNRKLILPAGATYWLRCTLRNPSAKPALRYLRLRTSDLYDARLYLNEGRAMKEVVSPPNRRTALFSLELPAGTTRTAYLYLDRRYLPVTMSLGFHSPAELLALEKRTDFGGGLYTGAGLLYLLVTLIQLLLLRNRESVFLFIYVIGGMLYLFYSRAEPLPGLLASVGAGHLFDTLPYASVAVSTIGYLGLFYLFFRLWEQPFWSVLVKSLQLGCALLCGLLLVWPTWVAYQFYSYLWLVQGVALLSVIGLSCILLRGGWLYWRKRQPDQVLFLLTFVPVLLLVLFIWLMEAGVLPRLELVYDNAPGLLIFYESTVLGALLFYRFLRERKRLRYALENERREVVQDLHSGLLPEVDTLRELNDRVIRPLSPAAHVRIDQLSAEISEDVRTLMWTLGRRGGEHFDELVGRLREKVHSRFADLPVETRFVTSPEVLPEQVPVPFYVSYHLFHLVKEVANNAAKHADASTFTCSLNYADGGFTLAMSDNGRGFDYRHDLSGGRHGLTELRQRAEKIGAAFYCESTSGEGTKMLLEIPRMGARLGK